MEPRSMPAVSQTGSHTKGQGKTRRKGQTDHSRFVGGRFDKQRNLHTRLIFGAPMRVDLHTCLRESKKFISRP